MVSFLNNKKEVMQFVSFNVSSKLCWNDQCILLENSAFHMHSKESWGLVLVRSLTSIMFVQTVFQVNDLTIMHDI